MLLVWVMCFPVVIESRSLLACLCMGLILRLADCEAQPQPQHMSYCAGVVSTWLLLQIFGYKTPLQIALFLFGFIVFQFSCISSSVLRGVSARSTYSATNLKVGVNFCVWYQVAVYFHILACGFWIFSIPFSEWRSFHFSIICFLLLCQ